MKIFLWLLLSSSSIWATPLPAPELSTNCTAVLKKARQMTMEEIEYDPSYYQMSYPGGDVPSTKGVCTDIVVRSLRTIGMDLQQLVHEDMRKNFSKYPKKYGNKKADSHIDHRRVWNLMTYFSRFETEVLKSQVAEDYKPCQIVSWDLGKGLVHIGVVSDRFVDDRPLIIHHIGGYPSEDDVLFEWPIIGHYSLLSL